jgi:hypothetical protein
VRCEPPGVNAHHLLVLVVCGNVRGRLNADSSPDRVPPPSWKHRPTNWSAVDGKTKDHGGVLQRHRHLNGRKVDRVGLRTPPVHRCRQHGGVHYRQTAGDEPSKQQEPRTLYEWRIPLIPRQGVARVDPERGQSMWNTTII